MINPKKIEKKYFELKYINEAVPCRYTTLHQKKFSF